MAKATSGGAFKKHKIRRPNVHSKTKQSKIKTSKNYVKKYRGQGR